MCEGSSVLLCLTMPASETQKTNKSLADQQAKNGHHSHSDRYLN